MKKTVFTRIEFEEGTMSGIVTREGDKVSTILTVTSVHSDAVLYFQEGNFNMLRGLVMKAALAIEESK
jgi:hypothetical protein